MIPAAAKWGTPRPRLLDRAMLRGSASSRPVDGLWLSCYRETNAEPALARVEQALDIIKLHDPIRYRRVIRDLEHIWIRIIVGSWAEFDESLPGCKLDERFVLAETTSPELIAAVIVHEAAHARIARCGIRYEESLRPRIEAICVRREIAFAAKLPDGQQAREHADGMLSLCADASYWTNAAFGDRYVEEAKKALEYVGTPNVLIRLFVIAYPWRVAAGRFFRRIRSLGFAGRLPL